MKEKNVEKVLQVYEQPIVEFVCFAADVLATANGSTDVGGEYPDDWN